MRNTLTPLADLAHIPPGDNEYYFKGTQPYNHAWKLHLCLNDQPNIYPDLRDPLIRDVSAYLIDRDIQHKYANGGDGFKTYTIYTGTPEANFSVAHGLNQRFTFPDRPRNLEPCDLHLAGSIYTRFEGQPYDVPGVSMKDSFFMHYGLHGIPTINTSHNFMPELTNLNGMTKPQKTLLHTLAGHVFCTRHYGDNYVGKHYAKTQWDHGLFSPLGDAMSLHDIQTYIDHTLARPLPHTLAGQLRASPVDIDVAALTQATNKPRNTFGVNTHSIFAKMHKPSGTILSRAHDANLIERIASKWQTKPV